MYKGQDERNVLGMTSTTDSARPKQTVYGNGVPLIASETITRGTNLGRALSEETLNVTNRLAALRNPSAPSVTRTLSQEATSPAISLEEKLFDARATAKQMIASVAMHIDATRRARLFKQLDSMHGVDEWNEADDPLRRDSFASFLRSLFHLTPSKYPTLGLSRDGHLLAAWKRGSDQLVIEFLPQFRARWSLSRTVDREVERAAGENAISRLRSVLSPYQPEHWLDS
jgi:hypothetical protein